MGFWRTGLRLFALLSVFKRRGRRLRHKIGPQTYTLGLFSEDSDLNEKYGNSFGSYTTRDTTTALKRIEQNAAFLFTIPGPKMIWDFGELGYDYSRCYLSSNGEGGDCDTKLDPKPIRWDYFQKIPI